MNYRNTSGWVATSLTSSALSQGTVYTIEIMANNKSTGTINYTYNGVSRSVAVQKFDLYVNGSLVGDDISTSQLTAGSTINAATFMGINSTLNVANLFVDDFVVYNAVPASIGASAPTLTAVTLGSALAASTYGTASAGTSFTAAGTALTGNITVTAQSGFEVSTASGSGYGSSVSVASGTTVWVRTAATRAAGAFNSTTVAVLSGGGAASNANVTSSGSNNSVAAKALTITGASATNRAYNGSTTVAVSGGSLVGVESGDTVALGGSPTGTVTSAAVGNGKAVTVTGYSISGASSGNYTLTQPTGLTVNITQKALTVSGASATNRAYNGSTTVAVSGGSLVGVESGDTVTLGGSPTGTVVTAAVGNTKAVTVTGYSISGASSGNYSLTQPTGVTVNITKANQTITFGALSAVNFGASNFNLTASANSGLTVSYTSSNTNVATVAGNTVTVGRAGTTTITASQAGDGNYNAATSVDQTLTVNAVAPGAPTLGTITAGDGQLSVAFTAPASDGGESISNYEVSTNNGTSYTALSPAQTASPLIVPGLSNGTTYTVLIKAVNSAGAGTASGSGTGTPQAAAVPTITASSTVSGAVSTTYGTPSSSPATFTVSGATLTGNLSVVPPSGFEVSTSIGSGYTTNLTLTESGGSVALTTVYARLTATAGVAGSPYSGNIVVSGGGASSKNVATVSSSVSAQELTVTGLSAENKVYNGNTTVSVTGTAAFSGLVNGESFNASANSVSWAFPDKNVGTGKTLTQTGTYANPSANYSVTQPTLTANITAKELTVTGATAQNKTYNGNTAATISGATLSGVVDGDTVSLTGGTSGTFASANVANGISVSTSMGISGADSGNYTFTAPTGLSANITAAAVTITGISISNKVYDGNTTASISGTAAYSGLVNSETFSVTGTPSATFANKTVANGKSVTVSGYTAPSGNYSITQPTGLTANITAKQLTITGVTAANKVYNGNTTATLNTSSAALSGVVGGDTVTLSSASATGAFATKTVADGKSVTASGFSISGADSGNYSLTQPATTANITALGLTVTGASVTPKTFDGTTTATITGATLSGVVGGDTVSLTGGTSGTFASANVGTGISVTTSMGTTGADSGNYSISQPTLTGNITQASQTITFAELPADKKVGDAAFSAGATATLGATISYSSSNTAVATVNASTGLITLVAPGVTTITATVVGTANFTGDTESQTLNVAAAGGSGTIAKWTFETSKPSATAASITAISAEEGTGTASGLHASSLTVWSNPAGNGSAESFSANTWASGDYFQFQVSTTGRSGISLSFDATRSGSGPATAKIQYSIDGTTFTDLVSTVAIGTETWSSTTASINSSFSYDHSSVSNINNQSNVYFRIVATASPGGTSGTFRVDNVTVTYSATPTPAITPSGTFAAVTTTYGTASTASATTVTVSGGSLTANITATAPTGFQVSSDGTTYGSTATFTQTDGFANGTLYLRLAATAAAGSYNDQVVTLSSTGASNQTLAIANSTVSQKALTVTNTSAITKVYDGSNSATFTGDLVGVVGEDVVSLMGTGTYASVNVGTGLNVTSSSTLTGAAADNYSLTQPTGLTGAITAAGLAAEVITLTLTPGAGNAYTASGPEGSTFDIAYSGRTANGITTTYSSATAPTGAGYYTATATATGNFSGSNSTDYFIAGPVAVNDEVLKLAAEDAIIIEGSSLLVNDRRIDSAGAVQTGNLSLTDVGAGTGNAAQLDGADVLFLTTGGASPWTFTYTLTDSVAQKTAIGTVTVSDGAAEQPFNLEIVRIGTATFDGANTSVTHDFVGVPNQTYHIEYSTDLTAPWTSAGNQSTGPTGSFAVTITRAGNIAADWNSKMFFRARLVTTP